MKLQSTFQDGEEIPREHGFFNGNEMPSFKISDIPDNTNSLALFILDPDTVEIAQKVWIHLGMYNIPPDTTDITDIIKDASCIKNSFEEDGYGGMAPPDKEHNYQFKLYALSKESIQLPEDLEIKSIEQFDQIIGGIVIDSTILKGTYAPDK